MQGSSSTSRCCKMIVDYYSCTDCWTSGIVPEFYFPVQTWFSSNSGLSSSRFYHHSLLFLYIINMSFYTSWCHDICHDISIDIYLWLAQIIQSWIPSWLEPGSCILRHRLGVLRRRHWARPHRILHPLDGEVRRSRPESGNLLKNLRTLTV